MGWRRKPPAAAPETLIVPFTSTSRVVVLEARLDRVTRIAKAFLEAQSDLEAEDRNDEGLELALDVLVAVAEPMPIRPSVPVVPGRP
jgi:hypothetical protein